MTETPTPNHNYLYSALLPPWHIFFSPTMETPTNRNDDDEAISQALSIFMDVNADIAASLWKKLAAGFVTRQKCVWVRSSIGRQKIENSTLQSIIAS